MRPTWTAVIAAILAAPGMASAVDFKGIQLGAPTTFQAVSDALGFPCSSSACLGETTIAGQPARSRVAFDGVTVARIDVIFEPRDFPAVLAACQKKYGVPSASTATEKQNLHGAKFLVTRVTWRFADGSQAVLLDRDSVSEGSFALYSAMEIARREHDNAPSAADL